VFYDHGNQAQPKKAIEEAVTRPAVLGKQEDVESANTLINIYDAGPAV
jgi:hypothetical protein